MGNKNHLKNINDQNFSHFMRGYDKGFYGSRLILANNRLEKCCVSDIVTDEITDESYEFSNEIDEFQNNTTTFTSQFKIIPSGTDWNCLFRP